MILTSQRRQELLDKRSDGMAEDCELMGLQHDAIMRLWGELAAPDGKKANLPGLVADWQEDVQLDGEYPGAPEFGLLVQANIASSLRAIANELLLIRKAMKGGK